MNTKMYHEPPDGPLAGSSYGMEQQDIAGLGKSDQRQQRSTSKLGATQALISRVVQSQAPAELRIRR
jgi:hypothetical protein